MAAEDSEEGQTRGLALFRGSGHSAILKLTILGHGLRFHDFVRISKLNKRQIIFAIHLKLGLT